MIFPTYSHDIPNIFPTYSYDIPNIQRNPKRGTQKNQDFSSWLSATANIETTDPIVVEPMI
jgi:hypothetical protein